MTTVVTTTTTLTSTIMTFGNTNLERYFLVLVQEHAELADADSEVTVCELIGNVEP